ncbi:hypothetical protein A8B82_15805 [Sulfitobacter sp. EhC04]|uniref:tetratricopeptide repeat protein n=1 Tax=Sulfitobacter sp. EhC04 TaxID=1849168 RepID=UPI0007F4CEAB|nr:tetratricopeptide repeat protein [Sulfitobacter sp. EhC04]OAN75975.1 hypothetical protein A8B82_15805 [Sulfitobacter sp. EhC04]
MAFRSIFHAVLASAFVFAAGSVWAQSLADISLPELQTQAERGQADAQFALGLRYHLGEGTSQDYSEAAKWFALAAAQGHAGASNQLARYRFEGLGGDKDVEEALRLFEDAAASGDPQNVFDLGRALEVAEGDMSRVAQLYQQAADAGLGDASVSLGVLYQEGRGVEQDYLRALELYEGPAAQGNARALNNLGLLYVRGTGVPQDYARAAEYFAAAVELGLATAMTNLGVLYENGYGVELDEERAKELYRAGGRQAEPDAGQQSTLIYDARLKPLELSEEVLQDVQSRAIAGDPVGMFQLGWVLLQSPDAPFQNQFQAAALFRAAAEAGYAPAMANLGSLYFQGKGVPQDFVLAQMWILRAAAAGAEEARNIGDGYIARMTAEQINEAQSRAKVIP